ncbi:unnamed protein product [Rotaria magnacalcarata]
MTATIVTSSTGLTKTSKQNATTQAQISIEQQTADDIAAQVKPPPINNKQHKNFSRARRRMFFQRQVVWALIHQNID